MGDLGFTELCDTLATRQLAKLQELDVRCKRCRKSAAARRWWSWGLQQLQLVHRVFDLTQGTPRSETQAASTWWWLWPTKARPT